MENDNKSEDNPCTSKHDNERLADECYDSKAEDMSRSNSTSSHYSAASRTNLPRECKVMKKLANVRKLPKLNKKKTKKRLVGRIEKRTKKLAMKKRPRRKPMQKLLRKASVSTIVTDVSDAARCVQCGHRCCRRRLLREKARCRRLQRSRNRREKKNKRPKKRNDNKIEKLVWRRKKTARRRITKVAAGIQAGSKSMIFSPLCIATNADAPPARAKTANYEEITPEIIYETMKLLTMWRQGVTTGMILQYICATYPLMNRNQKELRMELEEKMRVAVACGMVTKVADDVWSLNTALERRFITKNHVSLFWELYMDTLQPVTAKKPPKLDFGKDKSDSKFDENMVPNVM